MGAGLEAIPFFGGAGLEVIPLWEGGAGLEV